MDGTTVTTPSELEIRRAGTSLGDARARSEEANREADGENGETRNPVLATLTGSGRPGLHTVEWDLLSEQPRARALGAPEEDDELRRVEPGTYNVSLTVNGRTLTRTFEVTDGWF